MKQILIAIALLAISGTSSAQPPTAPAPRPVDPDLTKLTFTYTESTQKPPKLAMEVKNDKIEVQWTLREVPYTAVATRVVVNGDMVVLNGTEKAPVVLTVKRVKGTETVSANTLVVVLSEGRINVVEVTAKK